MEDNYIIATKFYFINPVDLLTPIIDALIRLEFETYIVQKEEKNNLFKILDIQSQHVLFISLRNRKDALDWLDSSAIISQRKHIKIKLGAFVYSIINTEILEDFQSKGIEIIPITRIKDNAFAVIRQIITLYDAKNRRKYLRAKCQDNCLAFLQNRDQDHTIRAVITDISTHTFACKIDIKDEIFIQKKLYQDVFLSLKGMQIQVSAKLIGTRHEDENKVYLFTIRGDGRVNSQTAGSQKIPSFIRKRLYTFIKNFLFDNIRQRLALYNEGY